MRSIPRVHKALKPVLTYFSQQAQLSTLGQASKGERLYMRVCDFWRREGDLLAENWVFVDIPHVLDQMGFDLFAETKRSLRRRRRRQQKR